MSLMIISVYWPALGILISTSSMCFSILMIPILAMFYNSITNNHLSLADRSTIFLPVSSFQHLHSRGKVKSRIMNKVVASTMIAIILIIQFIVLKELYTIYPTDLW